MVLTDAQRNVISERIKINTEIVKLFGLMIIATATGIFSLILSGIDKASGYMITLIGLIVMVLFIGIAIVVYKQTLSLLREIRIV